MRVVIDPIPIFDGRIDGIEAAEDPDSGEGAVSVSASSVFGNFDRRNGRRTNNEDQQVHFPGDLGLEFTSELVRDIVWGEAAGSFVPAGGSGSGVATGPPAGGNDDNPPDMSWSD